VETLLIVARIGLAAVFLLAAFGKLRDLAGTRQAVADFGVPQRFVRVFGTVLPVAELVAAVLLLPAGTAVIGGGLTLVLLLAFVAGITVALSQGRTPDCHCFGQVHSAPAGRETLVRNAALAALSGLIVVGGGGPSIGAWISESTDERLAAGLLGVTSFAAGLVAWTLFSENRRLRNADEDFVRQPPVGPGEHVPGFSLLSPSGSRVGALELAAEADRSILVFTSATCNPCHELLPELARWKRSLEGRLAIHVVASGDETENRRLAEQHDIPLHLDPPGEGFVALRLLGTPTGLEIQRDGVVVSPPVPGALAIENLIRAALQRPSQTAIEVLKVEGAGRATAQSRQ
jgi:uncharacterized membrane protein YphA (DoxX/SURF4 family)